MSKNNVRALLLTISMCAITTTKASWFDWSNGGKPEWVQCAQKSCQRTVDTVKNTCDWTNGRKPEWVHNIQKKGDEVWLEVRHPLLNTAIFVAVESTAGPVAAQAAVLAAIEAQKGK